MKGTQRKVPHYEIFSIPLYFLPSVQASYSAIIMEAIPLCLLLSKPYLFSLTHTVLLNQSELLSLVRDKVSDRT